MVPHVGVADVPLIPKTWLVAKHISCHVNMTNIAASLVDCVKVKKKVVINAKFWFKQ